LCESSVILSWNLVHFRNNRVAALIETKSVQITLKRTGVRSSHSLLFIPAFLCGEGRGGSSPKMSRCTSRQQKSQIVLLAPHKKTGPSKVADVATPPGRWSTFPWV